MIRGTKRPRVKAIEIMEPKAQKIDAQLNVSIHNRFDIEVIDAKTGDIKQRAQAENVICSGLWSCLFTQSAYFRYIHYGTGSGTPASTDTALFAFLGYAMPEIANDVYGYDWSTGVASLKRKIQLSESTAVGSTLTEVGIGYNTTAATLSTHAMLKDMNGNQISIAKTSTDVINIYATIFVHFNSTGYSGGSIKMAKYKGNGLFTWLFGLSSGAAIRRVIFSRNWFYPASTSGGQVYFKTPTFTYSSANKTLTITAPRLAIADANVNGIRQITLGDYYEYYSSGYYYYSLPIIFIEPENSMISSAITGEALGTGDGSTVNFKTAYPFISGTPTVYVDGVVEGGITFDSASPTFTQTSTDNDTLLKFVEQVSGDRIVQPNSFSPAGIGHVTIYEFVDCAHCAITSFNKSDCTVEVSDDLNTWVTLSATSGTFNYRYWRLTTPRSTGGIYNVAYNHVNENNIHFNTAPNAGAVLTIDYTTKRIAKDANHVFDLTVTIQLGEYTE